MSGDNFIEDERFDGLYLNVAQTTRGIEPLLDTVFSFLRRKTDFFAGPTGAPNGTEAAIQKVQEVVRKHADLYEKSRKKDAPKKEKKAVKPKPPNPSTDDVIEMDTKGSFDISHDKQAHAQVPPVESAPVPAEETTKSTPEAAQTDESDEAPPVGNGGTVEGKYVWTQTLAEVNLVVPLPDNTRGRDLNVIMAKQHLKVGLKAKAGEWILNAPLTKVIICDDSFWTVEDGNRLVMNLQKLNQMEWWEGVCQGDPTINVRKIQPENSSLNDLDGETRKTVEKMMYDNRQKALGLPSSDEEQKLAMLEQFKASHPELDFSNAKIT